VRKGNRWDGGGDEIGKEDRGSSNGEGQRRK